MKVRLELSLFWYTPHYFSSGCIYAYYLLPLGEGGRAKAKEVVLQAKAKCETVHVNNLWE